MSDLVTAVTATRHGILVFTTNRIIIYRRLTRRERIRRFFGR